MVNFARSFVSFLRVTMAYLAFWGIGVFEYWGMDGVCGVWR